MAQIPVYVDDALKEVVERVAAQQQRSASFLIREWIKEGLKRANQVQTQTQTQPATTALSK